MKKVVLAAVILVAILVATVYFLQSSERNGEPASGEEVTLTKVRFGMLPYADHTYAIIGVRKGWFREVGIDLEFSVIKVEEIVPKLLAGQLDVVSTPPGILFAASAENRNAFAHFVFGDLFQGYAIMAPPGSARTVSEFLADGEPYEKAVSLTVSQLEGKVFAYPTEAAIKPFIDLVLEKGDLGKSDFSPLVLDDPLTVGAMRDGKADFQVGGVPSRITLQKEGFVPIISSIDFARYAVASSESPELASILQNGWASSREYFENHRETVLRLASVNYRIMRFINDEPVESAKLHMPYLSEATGEEFTLADAEVIYNDLNPFVTFEHQRDWFSDQSNPLYYAHVNGSILREFAEEGIFGEHVPDLESLIFADDIYRELDSLRVKAEEILSALSEESANDPAVSRLVSETKTSLARFDFLAASLSAAEAKRVSKGEG